MESGVLVSWHKKEGDRVEAGEVLFEVSTDKATVEHSALDEGYLRKILVQEGGEAKINQPLAIFSESADENVDDYTPQDIEKAPIPSISSLKQETPAPIKQEPYTRIIASPLAKKIAVQRGVDLKNIQGSGPRGRIVAKDLDASLSISNKLDTPIEIPLTPIRKVISQRLQEAKSTIPHFYITQLVDVASLLQMREQLAAHETKVSLNDCIIKAVAFALRDHPVMNSGFNAAKQMILQYKTIDISVAVSTDTGLITPIVPQANQKSLTQISEEVRLLAKKAKEGKLAPHEFQGGSFTISNMGMFGVTEFQAILNPPQVGILAVAGIQDVAFVKNGMLITGKGMNITLSADHRVVDGVAGAKFIKSVQKYLENPISLLM